jgi:hypothetical protein
VHVRTQRTQVYLWVAVPLALPKSETHHVLQSTRFYACFAISHRLNLAVIYTFLGSTPKTLAVVETSEPGLYFPCVSLCWYHELHIHLASTKKHDDAPTMPRINAGVVTPMRSTPSLSAEGVEDRKCNGLKILAQL